MNDASGDRWSAAAAVIAEAVDARVFPAAVVEVGDSHQMLWRARFGTTTFNDGAPPPSINAVFDLASLTKPLSTTALALRLERDGRLDLDEPIASSLADWRGADRASVTARDLLEHCAGLAPRLLDTVPASRREFEHEIGAQRLEYVPRSRAVYTDLGFILLGFLIADRGGLSLDEQFARFRAEAWADEIGVEAGAFLDFRVSAEQRARTVPTLPLPEDLRRGRALVGEVHDNYAAALGGIAGHAGLFGNVAGTGAMARVWLRGARGLSPETAVLSPAIVARAIRRSQVPGSSRALGWDTMLPSSSCGPDLSARAFGHVGFTGVSLWIDPEKDRYFVVLTNRVYGAGTSEQMQSVRRAFHSAVATA